jgi:DeoR/GlpR family transcriptional regulator of sugar metabolism
MSALGVERRERILRLLDDEGRVLASELAPRLGVSLDTIRRDLDELGAAGVLRRVRGGALPPSPSSPRFVDRAAEDVPEKRAIADVAVERLVRPGQLLALGGGTTVRELARRLPDDLRATVLTNAPDVAVALLDHPALEVVLLGGPVNSETRTVVGVEAIQALAGVRPDLCLLGACSLHAQAGVTVLHREEALVLRAMLRASASTAVLTASGKLGSAGPYVVGATSEIDALVTDADAPAAALAEIEELGVEVIEAR